MRLKPKGSYEAVLAAVGKSELGEPDRCAKLFRETPQISNLLDGEGALGMEALQKQELGAAKHRVVEATIREEAAEPSAPPAQQLRAEATTQTLVKATNATGSQAQPSTSSASSQAKPSASDAENQAQPSTGDAGSQVKPSSASSESQTQATQFFELTPEPQMFDMSPDAHAESFASAVSATLDAQAESQELRGQKIPETIAHHLGKRCVEHSAGLRLPDGRGCCRRAIGGSDRQPRSDARADGAGRADLGASSPNLLRTARRPGRRS